MSTNQIAPLGAHVRPYDEPPIYLGRMKSEIPGTYKIVCTECGGRGVRRMRGALADPCPKCHGNCELTMPGERHGDKAKRNAPTWKDVAFFVIGVIVVGSTMAALVMYRYGVFR